MKEYQECSNCILDTNDDAAISFDEKGVCNYCNTYYKNYGNIKSNPHFNGTNLRPTLDKIKSLSKGKKFDSIMGLSGGVDSSYLALKAKEWGLNPLLIHFDNGWNSELAVQNINAIIDYTGFELYTYVVDWEEFRDLQLSYVKAGVLDWEIPTDHGFFACLFNQAYKRGIKSILTGHNYQTESILPKPMRWSKMDVANLKDIHATFGKGKKIKSFPTLDFWKYSYFQLVMKFNRFNLLEMIDYNKDEAKKEIIEKMGWIDYGGKHYESFFTKFYQGYVLPQKFKVDKRKAHLSNLICSGQITKELAKEELAKPPYELEKIEADTAYFTKKLGIKREEFDFIMKQTPVPHLNYKSYETGLYRKHERFMKKIKPLTSITKKLIGK